MDQKLPDQPAEGEPEIVTSPAPASHTPSGQTDWRKYDRCACGAEAGRPCRYSSTSDGGVLDRLTPHLGRPERLASKIETWLATHPGLTYAEAVDVDHAAALAEDEARRVQERRTVGLEVLTDELRETHDVSGARGPLVGIVCRIDGQAVDVPEVDTLWAAAFRKPADVLSILLRQARMYADGLHGTSGAELLMPTPDVLTALDGTPGATFWSEPIELQARYIRPGWLVASLVTEDGEDRVTAVADCEDLDCVWRGDCTVITAGSTPTQRVHFPLWSNATVRIPAAVIR